MRILNEALFNWSYEVKIRLQLLIAIYKGHWE